MGGGGREGEWNLLQLSPKISKSLFFKIGYEQLSFFFSRKFQIFF